VARRAGGWRSRSVAYRQSLQAAGAELVLRGEAHLRFGEISPRQIWHAARFAAAYARLRKR
jgi:deoxyribodipyrimidine photolyase